jgi:hypothetical protein
MSNLRWTGNHLTWKDGHLVWDCGPPVQDCMSSCITGTTPRQFAVTLPSTIRDNGHGYPPPIVSPAGTYLLTKDDSAYPYCSWTYTNLQTGMGWMLGIGPTSLSVGLTNPWSVANWSAPITTPRDCRTFLNLSLSCTWYSPYIDLQPPPNITVSSV